MLTLPASEPELQPPKPGKKKKLVEYSLACQVSLLVELHASSKDSLQKPGTWNQRENT